MTIAPVLGAASGTDLLASRIAARGLTDVPTGESFADGFGYRPHASIPFTYNGFYPDCRDGSAIR